MNNALLLMTLFLIKHFICDFVLQQHGSRKGSRVFSEWFWDLYRHAYHHMVGTGAVLILAFYTMDAWRNQVFLPGGLVLLDFILHGIIDRIKAHPDLGGRWTQGEKNFWVALGADQLAHGLCYVLYTYILLRGAL